MRFGGRAILLDIEGTIAPIAFVRDVLFAYARRELAAFLDAHWQRGDVAAARAQVAADAGVGDFPRDALEPHLLQLMDRDAKTTGLKQLQGLIWQSGYERGELRSPLFADVPPALCSWRQAGIRMAIYSSGSVAAQKLFLSHTAHGDVTPLIQAYFDTTVGPKREPQSYSAIAARIGLPPREIMFVSDVPAELDAAAAAGIQTAWSVRPGNDPASTNVHPRIESFAEIRPG